MPDQTNMPEVPVAPNKPPELTEEQKLQIQAQQLLRAKIQRAAKVINEVLEKEGLRLITNQTIDLVPRQ